jgi:hypothetical protein
MSALDTFCNATVSSGRCLTTLPDKTTIHRALYHPTIYAQLKELIETNPSVPFRELADYDQEVFECCILPNLVAAIIVNKCVSCMTEMCYTHLYHTHNRQSDIYTLCTAFFVEVKTLTPISTNEMSCHDPAMFLARLPAIVCTYYDPTIFTLFVHACMNDIYTHNGFSITTMTISADRDWKLLKRFEIKYLMSEKPHIYEHLVNIIQTEWNAQAGQTYYCEMIIQEHRDNKHIMHQMIDYLPYCKQHLSEEVFTETIHETIQHLEETMSPKENTDSLNQLFIETDFVRWRNTVQTERINQFLQLLN